jgi:hypothetical protein
LDAAYKPATFVAEAGAGYGAEKQAK